MVLEIAQIDVNPGLEAEFEAGVAKAAPIFQRAKGCRGMELQRSVEKPSRHQLFARCPATQPETGQRFWRNRKPISAPVAPSRTPAAKSSGADGLWVASRNNPAKGTSPAIPA